MEPMKPLEPMKPMKPMEPMPTPAPWWPEALGEPSTTGGQDDWKYAVFAAEHRLAVARGGDVTIYDTGDHEISGVSQGGGELAFAGPNGDVALGSLKVVD